MSIHFLKKVIYKEMKIKGYLGSQIYQSPFVISFKSSSKLSGLIQAGDPMQNKLIKVILSFKKATPYLASKLLPLVREYKRNFVISEEMHIKVLEFLGRDLNTKLEDLTGFDRKEYKRYQKLFSKRYEKPHSWNLPWIPHSFEAKVKLTNFQEAIDYFKSLYISEGQKSML